MKTKLKTLSYLVLVSVLFLLLVIPDLVSADGMVIKKESDSNSYDYLNQTNQQVFIDHENGLERMIISIGTEKKSKGAVWIFPVPSSQLNQINVDIATSLPELKGENVQKKARSNSIDIGKILPATTQFYPIPFTLYSHEKGRIYGLPDRHYTGRLKREDTVQKHLKKEGITTELINAKTGQDLYKYLQDKDLKIKKGSIPVLDNYIDNGFTFVVSWISEPSESQSKRKGVSITFPTPKIYYPLLPTSVYKDEVIPITIKVLGHKSPEVFKDIKDHTKIKYFIDKKNKTEKELKPFHKGSTKNIKYTKIEIDSPSKFFTEDLWINSNTPLKTYYHSFIAEHIITSGIFLLVLISVVASIITGLIVFRDLRNKHGILKLGLIGLLNCLTIAGLIAITALSKTKIKYKTPTSLLKQIRDKGYIWKRKLATVLFVVVGLLLILGVSFLLSVLLAESSIATKGIFLMIVVFVVPPFLILAFAFFIKRIKPEDQTLFNQLKSKGYSSWSFKPKDKRKIVFIPLFSFLFLVISWLVIKLIEFII
mgnify:CR=1 FL=1